ncbi:hypothetical protein LIER_20896 [Lithospermum erythrorhizon]|uniref:Retrotransposon gag domain-containing protein n=1 Tax=Lithospermum erythrorhizon TaxID=34254 RepID=A0AAV3QTV0_LITER
MPFTDPLDVVPLPSASSSPNSTYLMKLTFLNSLTGKALDWYMELSLKSIDTYQATAEALIAKFGIAIQMMQEERILMDVKQGPSESLSSYYTRYNDLLLGILAVDDKVAYMAFFNGLAYGNLKKALVLKTPLSKDALTKEVKHHIKLEELKKKATQPNDLRETVLKRDRPRSPRRPPVWERIQQDRGQSSRRRPHSPPPPPRGLVKFNQPRAQADRQARIPLKVAISEIYSQVEDKNLLPKPARMRGALGKRDKNRYCEYHREHGHDANKCRILKAEIKKMIKRGYLKEFIGQERGRAQGRIFTPPREEESRPRDKRPSPLLVTGRIDTILGGIAGRWNSRNARKNYSRREVYSTGGVAARNEPIMFSDSELQGIELPHYDPVVISPLIANFTVERMLVDMGSSADILYLITYDKLQLPRSLIQPITTPLTGFTGHMVYPVGIVALDFTVRKGEKTTTIRAQFMVVDIDDTSYNGLIGRPILTSLRAIVSPLHLKLKFPSAGGIGEVCGNQKRARICYEASVLQTTHFVGENGRKRGWESQLDIKIVRKGKEEDNLPKERESLRRPVPHKEVEEIPFKHATKELTFKIGTRLGHTHQEELISLVREFEDVFAWGPEDMPGVDPKVAMHRLHVDSMFVPIKQRKRTFSDEKNMAIKAEVEALLKARASANYNSRNGYRTLY